MAHDKKNNTLIPLMFSVNTFGTSNKKGGQLWI